jgi:hypothetical protein
VTEWGLAGRGRAGSVESVPESSSHDRWISCRVGGEDYQLLNLDHPDVEARILREMRAGVEVYYDRRWEATGVFAEWLLAHQEWMVGKRILAVGAGVGLETVVLGRHGRKLFINDLAPVALELCREQLAQNGVAGVETVPGRLEEVVFPEVDLVVACFLVYNPETRKAVRALAERRIAPVLLVNESLTDFRRLLVDLTGRWEELFFRDGVRGIMVAAR